MTRPALLCTGLTKTYGSPTNAVTALEGVDLRVERGESIAVIGPNGSGKTTLLKIAAGITAPTSGRVDRVSRTSALIELGAGYDPELTGRENLDYGFALLGWGPNERRRRAVNAIEFSGLGDAMETPLKRYSDGMRARLSVAVALHAEPDLLLIDEVLAVGDGAFQRQAITAVRALVREGAALVLVTHDLFLARVASESAMWIEDGRVREVGPSSSILDRYVQSRSSGDATGPTRLAEIEQLTVTPTEIDPGDPVEVTAVVRTDADARPLAIRIDLRPPIGEDTSWMRSADEPPEHRDWNVIASTETVELRPAAGGRTLIRARLSGVPITPPSVEVLVAVIDPESNGIVDELGTIVEIRGTATSRKLSVAVTCSRITNGASGSASAEFSVPAGEL